MHWDHFSEAIRVNRRPFGLFSVNNSAPRRYMGILLFGVAGCKAIVYQEVLR
jgi:hypothetical protein